MSSATVNELRFGEFASSLLNDGNDGLRAGLDDTLNSADSRVGNPFSATVVDQGDTKRTSVRSLREG